MRLMECSSDPVSISDDPDVVPIVGCYLWPSPNPWSPGDRQARRDGGQQVVGIVLSPYVWGKGVHVLADTGDFGFELIGNWVRRSRDAGVEPTLRISQQQFALMINLFDSFNIPVPQFWIADASDNPVQFPPSIDVNGRWVDAVASTYADEDGIEFVTVADHWPVVDDVPAGPQPSTNTDDDGE